MITASSFRLSRFGQIYNLRQHDRMVGGGKYGCTFVSISCLQKLIDIDRNIVICGEEDAVFLFSPNPYTAQQNYYGKQDNYIQSATNHLKIKTSNICDEIIINFYRPSVSRPLGCSNSSEND